MDNPILTLRKALGLTQADLAKSLEITEQTVRRTEQGTYANPPLTLREWYDSKRYEAPLDYPVGSETCEAAYYRWRTMKRLDLWEYTPDYITYGHATHPFTQFRHKFMQNYLSAKHTVKGLSVTNSVSGFCKIVALEPKQVEDFERSYQYEIPKEIEVCLRQLNYMRINDLETALKVRHSIYIGAAVGKAAR